MIYVCLRGSHCANLFCKLYIHFSLFIFTDIITKGNKVLNIMGPLTSNISNYSQTIENAQISDHEAVSGLNFGENAEYLCKNLDVQLLQGSFEKSVATKDSVLKFNTISEQILADTTSPKKQVSNIYI